MGRAPAVVIIARHGARLDAADNQWHTTSPAPYDTPLSYGGWIQCRALGTRIASLLRARETALLDEHTKACRRNSNSSTNSSATCSDTPSPPLRRRQKVVIHTSPFLRCVQTSTAISAGMAEFHGKMTTRQANGETAPSQMTRLFTGPSRAQTLDSKVIEPRLADEPSLPSNTEQQPHELPKTDMPHFTEPILRIDACLGEWLSPGYYEFITAPPPSNMLVASAKAEMLRPPEALKGAKIIGPDGSVMLFSGSNIAEKTVQVGRERDGSFSFGMLADALQQPKAAPTVASNPSIPPHNDDDTGIAPESHFNGYCPPLPTYALGHSASIPEGYVAHARHACLQVDFQWDSMREPQQWGDGGVYGEEWSAMHRRFRSGIASMISWYSDHTVDPDPHDIRRTTNGTQDDDDDTDVVLVIVTHGAGCNALIGAITNQPVLMDVGMSSLTMALRKQKTSPLLERQRSGSFLGVRRRGSSVADPGLPEDYEVKILASTDHLRSGVDALHLPHLTSSHTMTSIPESIRTRANTNSSGTASPTDSNDRPISRNSALGSIRRTTVKSSSVRTFSPAPLVTSSATSNGLWGNKNANGNATPASPSQDMPANLDGFGPKRVLGQEDKANGVTSPISPVLRTGHQLWARSRDEPTKRRWTVGERR